MFNIPWCVKALTFFLEDGNISNPRKFTLVRYSAALRAYIIYRYIIIYKHKTCILLTMYIWIYLSLRVLHIVCLLICLLPIWVGTFDTNDWIMPSDPIRVWKVFWSYDQNVNNLLYSGLDFSSYKHHASGINPSFFKGNGCIWSMHSSNRGLYNLPVRQLRSGTQEPAATVAAAEKSKVCNREVSWKEMTGQPNPPPQRSALEIRPLLRKLRTGDVSFWHTLNVNWKNVN